MSNVNYTTLKCANPEVVKVFVNNYYPDKHYFDYRENWKEGDTKFYMESYNSVPYEEVKELSKRFPFDLITCRYNFEAREYSEVDTVEYRNGQDEWVDIEPGYSRNVIPQINEKDQEAIFDKVVAFCKKLDTKKKKEEGGWFLDWFPEEVCFKFDYDGENGKKYKVEAIKNHSHIDLEVTEGVSPSLINRIEDNTLDTEIPGRLIL